MRKFETVQRVNDMKVIKPSRSTTNAAGYDFYALEDIVIPSAIKELILNCHRKLKLGISMTDEILSKEEVLHVKPTMVKTGIKAYMEEDEVLNLYNRSSNPGKLGLILANGVGVVDADYADSGNNEGEIAFAFYNIFPFSITIKKGDKLGQGVFTKFLKTDDDVAGEIRKGGFGSTGK